MIKTDLTTPRRISPPKNSTEEGAIDPSFSGLAKSRELFSHFAASFFKPEEIAKSLLSTCRLIRSSRVAIEGQIIADLNRDIKTINKAFQDQLSLPEISVQLQLDQIESTKREIKGKLFKFLLYSGAYTSGSPDPSLLQLRQEYSTALSLAKEFRGIMEHEDSAVRMIHVHNVTKELVREKLIDEAIRLVNESTEEGIINLGNRREYLELIVTETFKLQNPDFLEKIIPIAQHLLELDPNSPHLFSIADVYIARNCFREVLAFVDRFNRNQKLQTKLAIKALEAYLARDDFKIEEAIALIDRIPESLPPQFGRLPTNPQWENAMKVTSQAIMNRGKLDELIALQTNNPKRLSINWLSHDIFEDLLRAKDFERAETLAAVFPTKFLFLELIRSYAQNGFPEEALKRVPLLSHEKSYKNQAYRHISIAFVKKRDFKKAQKNLQKISDQLPCDIKRMILELKIPLSEKFQQFLDSI